MVFQIKLKYLMHEDICKWSNERPKFYNYFKNYYKNNSTLYSSLYSYEHNNYLFLSRIYKKRKSKQNLVTIIKNSMFVISWKHVVICIYNQAGKDACGLFIIGYEFIHFINIKFEISLVTSVKLWGLFVKYSVIFHFKYNYK